MLSLYYGGDAARTAAGSDVGRWPWMVHARRTVVADTCSMCWGCVRCKASNPTAALSTACRKYTRAWVESATMRAMTSVRVSCRIRFGGRVMPLAVAACWTPGGWPCLLGSWAGPRGGGAAAVHRAPWWQI